MSVDTYKQMTTGVSDITSIALVTLEIINNTLLINMVRTTSDKQNSRTFQGLFKDTKLFFKDQGLFNKSTFFCLFFFTLNTHS